jgi:hypothetical protein
VTVYFLEYRSFSFSYIVKSKGDLSRDWLYRLMTVTDNDDRADREIRKLSASAKL